MRYRNMRADPMPGTFNWLVGERASHLSGAESYQRL
jgi:hypothetical protein